MTPPVVVLCNPFISCCGRDLYRPPPATLNPDQGLNALVQDTLRGKGFAAMPFFDQKQVIRSLDDLPRTDQGSRVASDQLLMMLTSAAVLNDSYRLAA